jgi:hypothetical protein
VQIDLLPCSPDDRDFVLRVTEEAMRTYVEEAFGSWDADVQRRHLEESFDPASYRLIVIDEVRAGILVVEDRPSDLFLQRSSSCRGFRGEVPVPF